MRRGGTAGRPDHHHHHHYDDDHDYDHDHDDKYDDLIFLVSTRGLFWSINFLYLITYQNFEKSAKETLEN